MPDRPERRHSLTRFWTPIALVALLLVGATTSSASAKFHSDRPQVTGFSFSPDAPRPSASRSPSAPP